MPYTVPVVVHVIHNGGPENIPDAQILAAIDHLNEGVAAQGYFAQLGATVHAQIQFCMAKRDPDGHATNGITRTQSPLTNMIMETQDIQTKDLNRWDPYVATHTNCPFNSCSTDVAPGSPFLTDVDDYTGAFLDYSPFPCYYFFTAGQAERMQASLEMTRSSLLESKGCITPCTQPIVVDFTVSPDPVLAGQTVTFTNNSSGASNFSWKINGQFISTQPDITYNFPATGSFTASLTATNSAPNCSNTLTRDFAINCPFVAEAAARHNLRMNGQTARQPKT